MNIDKYLAFKRLNYGTVRISMPYLALTLSDEEVERIKKEYGDEAEEKIKEEETKISVKCANCGFEIRNYSDFHFEDLRDIVLPDQIGLVEKLYIETAKSLLWEQLRVACPNCGRFLSVDVDERRSSSISILGYYSLQDMLGETVFKKWQEYFFKENSKVY